jgi:hypothetical protein
VGDIICGELGPSTVAVFLHEGSVVASVPLTKNAYLEISITNTDASQTLTSVAFTDTLPVTVGTLSGVSVVTIGTGCTAAIISPTAITLTAGSMVTGITCLYRALVTGTVVGTTSNSVTVTR